jgi:hypothetical protein
MNDELEITMREHKQKAAAYWQDNPYELIQVYGSICQLSRARRYKKYNDLLKTLSDLPPPKNDNCLSKWNFFEKEVLRLALQCPPYELEKKMETGDLDTIFDMSEIEEKYIEMVRKCNGQLRNRLKFPCNWR